MYCNVFHFILFFFAFFYNNNPAFHETNSSGKTLNTRQKIFCGPLAHSVNKPSFCSGSCDEIHDTTKLQNRTSLKDFWNFLWYFLDTFFNTLESSLKHLWNCLETPFELLWDTLKIPWITFQGLSGTPQSSLKHP